MLTRRRFVPHCVNEFARSRSGNVAMMFGLAILPLMAAVGMAIDYSRIADARTRLNGAADAATLQALSKNANPFVNTPTSAEIQQYFSTLAAPVNIATITSVKARISHVRRMQILLSRSCSRV